MIIYCQIISGVSVRIFVEGTENRGKFNAYFLPRLLPDRLEKESPE
jgi:hypothetical protein